MKKWLIIIVLIGSIGILYGVILKKDTKDVKLSDLKNYIESWTKKEYNWDQKVTLSIDIENITVTGSSLMTISWTENSRKINDAGWISSIKGEMPYVKLPDDSYVFSLFSNHSSSNLAPLFLLDGASTIGFDFRPGEKTLASPKSNVTLIPNSDLFPLLVRFTSLDDPSSISLFDSSNAKIIIEINPTSTDIPTTTIMWILPWLDKLPLSQSKRSPVAIPLENGRYVIPNKEDFIRE